MCVAELTDSHHVTTVITPSTTLVPPTLIWTGTIMWAWLGRYSELWSNGILTVLGVWL